MCRLIYKSAHFVSMFKLTSLDLIGLDYAMYTMRVPSGQYMGLACRVPKKITMTHGIQSKISVRLSVIRESID